MGSRSWKARVAALAVMLASAGSVAAVIHTASADTVVQLNASQLVADMGAGWNLGNSVGGQRQRSPQRNGMGQPGRHASSYRQGEGGGVQNDSHPGLLPGKHRVRSELHGQRFLAE